MRVDRLLLLLLLQFLALLGTHSDSVRHRRVLHTQPHPDTVVSSSYKTFRDLAGGLHRIDVSNSNVAASVFVAPEIVRMPHQPSDRRLELAVPSRDYPSTHLAFNCTTTAALWNLRQDPNVLKLEKFEPVNDNSDVPNSAAIATLVVADCQQALQTSVGRVVVGDSLFGGSFAALPAYFHVMSIVKHPSAAIHPSGSCRVRLELEHATFAHLYPDCRVKFHSTDIANLIRTESVVDATAQARRLEASTFGFVKDSSCKYDCGEKGDGTGEIDVDKCWAKVDGKWTEQQCKLQFYAKNSDCTTECGYEGDTKTLPVNQCYDCSSDDDDDSCRVLSCTAVEDTTTGTLSWNLEDDAVTVSNSSYPIFETGNCSDTSDPLTDCCRVTCENCFLNVSIASLFADLEVVGVSFEEAIEMELTGNANLQVALYAPNGCTLDETMQLKNASFTIPLGETGISVEITMGLDLRRRMSLQPHGSIVNIGATAELQSLTAGSLRSEKFHDVQISTNTSSKLAQSSIDLEMELELTPSFQASLSLLKGLAKVGVKTEFVVFVELNSTFQYPDPIPGLSSRYLDESSLWHGGDCRLPHFMEYNGNAGYGQVNVSIPLSLAVSRALNTTTELDILSSSDRSSFSLFSGCVATAYDAEVLLSTAIDTVSALSGEKMDALRTILVWTLGLTDIDPEFVNVTEVSTATGEILLTLSVPPSLGELYPNASDFVAAVYQRARNETFVTKVSDYVGLDVGAQCNASWWGPQCDRPCSAQNCTSGGSTCNAVDGTLVSCSMCKYGYWGSKCENLCQVPADCTNARCDQTTGDKVECVSCDDAQNGSLCGGGDTTSGSDPVQHFASVSVLVLTGLCLLTIV